MYEEHLDIGPTKKVENLMSVDDDTEIVFSNNKNVRFETNNKRYFKVAGATNLRFG